MPGPLLTTAAALRHVYGVAHDPQELALAAHMLHGKPPADWEEFLNFFVLEWVDARGYTAIEAAVEAGVCDASALRLSSELRTALWVVDGWEDQSVLLRDLATESEVAVHAPGRQSDLPKRTVLRARVVPEIARPDQYIFSGSPDLYDGLGVIARMDLLRAWQETPEPDLHARLAALREAFLQQREEQAAFLTFFGADQQIFSSADHLNRDLARFISFLGNEWVFPSLGTTRATAHRATKGDEPKVVQVQIGDSLKGPGRPGIVYDRVHGVHFLPALGDLLDHFSGAGVYPEVLQLYLDEPDLSPLAFRAAPPELRALKTAPSRATPSVLPGWPE